MRRLFALVTVLGLAACGDSPAKEPLPDAPMGDAMLTAMPVMVDFGPVGAGDPTSPFVMVRIINSGYRSTGILNTQLAFTDASQFLIVSDGCRGGIVAPLGECTVQLQFRPETPTGAMHANLVVDASPGGDLVVPLTGTGVVDVRPRLMASTSTALFGDQAIGTTSAVFPFTITNPGASPTGAISVSLAGADAAAFSVNTTCSQALPAAGTCTVSVGFHPGSAAAFAATVNLAANPGTSIMLNVSGTGADIVLAGAPSSFDFGYLGVGFASAPKTITITNTGTHASGTIDLQRAGANPNDVIVENDLCGGNSLAPGASCTVDARFAPQSAGAKAATLVATARGATASVSLTGTTIMALSANPTSLPFADQTVGSTSAAQTFTVTNTGTTTTGTINLAITGAGAASFGKTTTCTTLAPAASCDVLVTFSPAALGTQQASVTATAPGTNTVAVAVHGDGI
jgi:hypothetical protein